MAFKKKLLRKAQTQVKINSLKQYRLLRKFKEEKQVSEATTLNNQVALSGRIISNFEFSHEAYGEKFYTLDISVERASGMKDIIPVMTSDRLIDVSKNLTGQYIKVTGQFRSYNKHTEDKSQLILSVFAKEFEIMEERPADEIPWIFDKNTIFLDGYVCKKPVYRETALGRGIADILLAVNRPYRKSDYIPCIVWGRNTIFASSLEVGTRLQIEGRIQSREYQKKISEDMYEKRVAYEISASKLQKVEKEF